MDYLDNGKYYGSPQKTSRINGLIITDNEYIHEKVGWHYHENAYFTYLLKGLLIEANKRETYNCSPGSLLFHWRQEPHYNLKPPGYTRGFQVEFEKEWFTCYGIDTSALEGASMINHPRIKNLFNCIYRESKINDESSTLAIESLVLSVLNEMTRFNKLGKDKIPSWVNKVIEILHAHSPDIISLKYLSAQTGIHPVHISAAFPKYLNITIGGYTRSLKVERSAQLLSGSSYSLTEISNICGFADQSHFIRSFRSVYKLTPLQYRKLLTS